MLRNARGICAKMTGSAGDSPGGGFATILFISRHHADLYSAGWSVAHPRIFNYVSLQLSPVGPFRDLKRRGYGYVQFLTVYENFSGKVRSVLLLCNSLFNRKIIKKRKDLAVVILGQK